MGERAGWWAGRENAMSKFRRKGRQIKKKTRYPCKKERKTGRNEAEKVGWKEGKKGGQPGRQNPIQSS